MTLSRLSLQSAFSIARRRVTRSRHSNGMWNIKMRDPVTGASGMFVCSTDKLRDSAGRARIWAALLALGIDEDEAVTVAHNAPSFTDWQTVVHAFMQTRTDGA